MYQKQVRQGLVVYLYYNRDARKIAKYGDIVYHSKRLRYQVLYVNKEDAEATVSEIRQLKFVKDVQWSAQDSIDYDFVGSLERNDTSVPEEYKMD